MNVTCDRAALLEAVNLVSGVVAARTPRPQLTCVRISASKEDGEGRLTLSATDTEVSLKVSDPNVEVEKEGDALVPAQKLQQIVAAEDADPTLRLETEQDLLQLRGADSRFRIFGYPPSDFPPTPDFPAPSDSSPRGVFRVEGGDFDTLIARTLFATARETSRYAINGVLLKLDGKKLELVATDGRRLALARGSADVSSGDGPLSCIIPSKALSLVSKLIDEPDEPVRVAVTDNQAIFAFGDPEQAPVAVLATTLVEGAFPPYEDVIPRDQDKKATFDVGALRSGVRRAALLTNEESRGVRMALTKENGAAKLRLSSRAPELGEAEIDIDVADFDGDDIEIGFNPSFILDALKIVEEEQITLELKAPNRPGVMKSGPDFLYVVMPVSLQ